MWGAIYRTGLERREEEEAQLMKLASSSHPEIHTWPLLPRGLRPSNKKMSLPSVWEQGNSGRGA